MLAGAGFANQWFGEGGSTMALEDEFHQEMFTLYRETGQAIGDWANYYLRGVRNKGGLAYAKHLLAPGRKIDSGLQRLADAGRTDLSVEARVLKPRYAPLFTPAERTLSGRPVSAFLLTNHGCNNDDSSCLSGLQERI